MYQLHKHGMCKYAQSSTSKSLWKEYVNKLTHFALPLSSCFYTKIYQMPGPASFIPNFLLSYYPTLPLHQPYINPYTFQHCYFSPKDGDNVVLWNVGICQWVYIVPKPRTVSSFHSDVMLLPGTPSHPTDIFYFNIVSLLIYNKVIEIPGIWTFWQQ
jgi:hypothetical protein